MLLCWSFIVFVPSQGGGRLGNLAFSSGEAVTYLLLPQRFRISDMMLTLVGAIYGLHRADSLSCERLLAARFQQVTGFTTC